MPIPFHLQKINVDLAERANLQFCFDVFVQKSELRFQRGLTCVMHETREKVYLYYCSSIALFFIQMNFKWRMLHSRHINILPHVILTIVVMIIWLVYLRKTCLRRFMVRYHYTQFRWLCTRFDKTIILF